MSQGGRLGRALLVVRGHHPEHCLERSRATPRQACLPAVSPNAQIAQPCCRNGYRINHYIANAASPLLPESSEVPGGRAEEDRQKSSSDEHTRPLFWISVFSSPRGGRGSGDVSRASGHARRHRRAPQSNLLHPPCPQTLTLASRKVPDGGYQVHATTSGRAHAHKSPEEGGITPKDGGVWAGGA